eukprot:TRINITY_DN80202_c0_g1_i1.p1 TRINITY_DN80202_c0_g1~~TRINITY_DN80202_c0_g1_i1.p1  ORF type:complete len:163 (-),score=30.91 TRINITY_DN80202_c0_g1_i1:133-621(-)
MEVITDVMEVAFISGSLPAEVFEEVDGMYALNIPEPMYINTDLATSTLREWQNQAEAKAADKDTNDGRKVRSRPGKRRRDRIKAMLATNENNGSAACMVSYASSRTASYYNKLQLGMPWKVNVMSNLANAAGDTASEYSSDISLEHSSMTTQPEERVMIVSL